MFGYHLFPGRLPGGFIGVDAFFVISGFLITAHLHQEHAASGRIRIAAFYGRRIRRLLPASFLVLGVSLALTAAIFPAAQLTTYPADIAAAALYIVNWTLAYSSTGYAHVGDAPSIAQQYWSLSVEEQFYAVWPVLLTLAWLLAGRFRSGGRSSTTVFRTTLALIAVASFVSSILQTRENQAHAYFFTTARAWEFALGGLVALTPAATGRAARMVRTSAPAVAWLALVAVLAAAARLTDQSAFPGYIAAWPVVAVAVLLYLGDSGTTWEPARLSRRGPLLVLGGISYAVYLWHWPLIGTFAQMAGRVPTLGPALGIVVTTIALAMGTKKYVEDPMRFGSLLAGTHRSLVFALVGSLVLVAASTGVSGWAEGRIAKAGQGHTVFADEAAARAAIDATLAADTWPGLSRFSSRARSSVWFDDNCIDVTDESDIARCTYGAADGSKTIVVLGDSFAASYMPGIAEGFASRGWRVLPLTLQQCSAAEVTVTDWVNRGAEFTACTEHRQWALAQIAELKPDLVVVGNSARSSLRRLLSRNRGQAGLDEWATGLDAYLRRVVPMSPRTVVIGSSPLPTCRVATSPRDCAPKPVANPVLDAERAAATAAGAEFVDTRAWYCSADLTVCPEFIDGTFVYPGEDAHVTDAYAKRLGNLFYNALAGGSAD